MVARTRQVDEPEPVDTAHLDPDGVQPDVSQDPDWRPER